MGRDIDMLRLGAEELTTLFAKEFEDVYLAALLHSRPAGFTEWLEAYAERALRQRPDEAVARAAARLLQMVRSEGETVTDLSTGESVRLDTLEVLHTALRGERPAGADFLLDIIYLLRALDGYRPLPPSREKVVQWSRRWESGLDEGIVRIRQRNRERICELLVERLELRKPGEHQRFYFPEGATREEKRALVDEWWGDFRFHLSLAIRSPRELNKYLDYSLPPEVMRRLYEARQKEMPFFLTPYYASLLDTSGRAYDDKTIRNYVIYSQQLVDAYGEIRAWEKEDQVVGGQPNAAGWVLPEGNNIHRRYPEVAIMIPDSMGRACGGLCAPCQRMYDFQNKRLNFEFNALRPNEHWDAKLRRLMRYFEYDADLRDILITGGDALMSQNATLRNILEAVLRMAARKRAANASLPEGERRATIDRIRLGSRLPAYLPMRMNDELIAILRDVRERGEKLGITQFFIQTHFESPLEMTPEAQRAIHAILSAGWLVTNQLVFTAAASRRGHTARLRRILSKEGVVCYYTFSVKGFGENYALFAPNARSMQEASEEKPYGLMPPGQEEQLAELLTRPQHLRRALPAFMRRHGLPFLSTDRNVLNLPGIGKSMTFTTAGVTPDGRRILRFEHDAGRRHSPVIDAMGEVYITESKSLAAYLRQMHEMGEHVSDYATLWSYDRGETEPRFRIYEYP